VVAGAASDVELTPRSRAAANIVFLPPNAAAGSRGTGSGDAVNPSTLGIPPELLDAAHLRDIQGAASMHVCPALRGGFVHTLNEARAVGALVVTVDHPGMNEMVKPDSGLLVPAVSTDSDPGAELGVLTHLNGHISVNGLCGAVAKGLELPEAAQQAKRAAAQAAYRADKAAFMHRMQQLRRFLEARVQQQRRQ
jgi:glycosyltransferase involved in cell wall biosynthesis